MEKDKLKQYPIIKVLKGANITCIIFFGGGRGIILGDLEGHLEENAS